MTFRSQYVLLLTKLLLVAKIWVAEKGAQLVTLFSPFHESFRLRAEICRRAAVSASDDYQKLGWPLHKLYLTSVLDRWFQSRFDNQLWQKIGTVRHIWTTCIYCELWSKVMIFTCTENSTILIVTFRTYPIKVRRKCPKRIGFSGHHPRTMPVAHLGTGDTRFIEKPTPMVPEEVVMVNGITLSPVIHGFDQWILINRCISYIWFHRYFDI